MLVYPLDDDRNAGSPTRFSSHHHCAHCDISYPEPSASHFSFNSPIGACDTCRGFGCTIGVDWVLVVPDVRQSLKDGAITPIQTQSYAAVQRELITYARQRGV